MSWLKIILGVCLILLGSIWFSYQVRKTKEYKKEDSYTQLSTQPSQYIGILILIVSGILLIYRSLRKQQYRIPMRQGNGLFIRQA